MRKFVNKFKIINMPICKNVRFDALITLLDDDSSAVKDAVTAAVSAELVDFVSYLVESGASLSASASEALAEIKTKVVASNSYRPHPEQYRTPFACGWDGEAD